MTSNNSSASMNGWGPYSGARDFNRSMLIIVFILVFVIFFFLLLRATSRFLYSLRARRARMQQSAVPSGELKEQIEAVVAPTRLLVFSEEIMGEANSASECAICLCEFEEGDGLRVLPNCKHWFHERCIEVWLSCGGSCPTCRTSCASMAKYEPEKERE